MTKNLAIVKNWIWQNQLGKVASNTILILGGASISQAFMLFSMFLTARYLGVERYGQYVAIFTLLGQAAVLLNFGLDSWLLREGAKSTEILSQNLSDALLIKLFIALPWFIAVILISALLNPDVYSTPIITVAALGFILQAVGTLAQATFKSQLRNKITFLLQISGNTILIVSTWLLVQKNVTIIEFVWVRSLSLLAMAGVGLYFLLYFYNFQPSLNRLKSVIRQSVPFMQADALGFVYVTADITIIAVVLGKMAIGVYAPAIVLINAAFIVPNSIHFVALPIIARAYHINRQDARIPSIMLIVGLAVEGLLAAVVTFIFATPIISLIYGKAFISSALILSILSVILFFKALNFALGTILTTIDRQKDRVWVQVFIATGNVLLNLLIINIYELVGVAWVYVITEFCLVLGYGWFVLKNTQWFSFEAEVVKNAG